MIVWLVSGLIAFGLYLWVFIPLRNYLASIGYFTDTPNTHISLEGHSHYLLIPLGFISMGTMLVMTILFGYVVYVESQKRK